MGCGQSSQAAQASPGAPKPIPAPTPASPAPAPVAAAAPVIAAATAPPSAPAPAPVAAPSAPSDASCPAQLSEFLAKGSATYKDDPAGAIKALSAVDSAAFDLSDPAWEKWCRQSADVLSSVVGPAPSLQKAAEGAEGSSAFTRSALLFALSKATLSAVAGPVHVSGVEEDPSLARMGSRIAQFQWLCSGKEDAKWSMVVVDAPTEVKDALRAKSFGVALSSTSTLANPEDGIQNVRCFSSNDGFPAAVGLLQAGGEFRGDALHVVARLDANGESSAAALGVCVSAIAAGGADVVFASRSVGLAVNAGAAGATAGVASQSEKVAHFLREMVLPGLAGVTDASSGVVVARNTLVKDAVQALMGTDDLSIDALIAELAAGSKCTEAPAAFASQRRSSQTMPSDVDASLKSAKLAAQVAKDKGGQEAGWIAFVEALDTEKFSKVAIHAKTTPLAGCSVADLEAVVEGPPMVSPAASADDLPNIAPAAPAAAAAEEPPAAHPLKNLGSVDDLVASTTTAAAPPIARRDFGSANSLSELDKVKSSKVHQLKEVLRSHFTPEYTPESVKPPTQTLDTLTERATRVSLPMVVAQGKSIRKTKIVCTMGPKCWDEETLGKLIDAGLGIARFNFSHGSHEDHGAVLERYRKVCEAKGVHTAALLDTKGPEIRTAMLKDHAPITLEAGQDIIVEAVGDKYTEFEGFKTEEETRIGLSYAKLCQSVHPGSRILCADGTISIEVVEILDATTLKGKVLNTKTLGERKNCNLPGVKVDIPVLTEKDIDDLQNFGCKNKVDFVAASFVQTAEDVQFIRKTLDDAGGQNIQIISKIENEEGLNNFEEILKYTDGVMVARGDLGMEIPSEKVPAAQKWMITKSNIAGKFVICATQMLESMVSNPLPTRAEMTDVANAVFDGADATMLSGETANGSFPDVAVDTMARILLNAELGVDFDSQFQFIRSNVTANNTVAVSADESVYSNVAKCAVEFMEDTNGDGVVEAHEGATVLVITESGAAADMVAKYRPPCPIVVVSADDSVLRQTNARFAMVPFKVDSLDNLDEILEKALTWMIEKEFSHAERPVVVCHGCYGASADKNPCVKVISPDKPNDRRTSRNSAVVPRRTITGMPLPLMGTVSLRSTAISLELISQPVDKFRGTKIVCTMGPKCWDEETLGKLLDAGLNIARFNFSHGTHEAHGEVLERYRKVCEAKGKEIMEKHGLPAPPLWGALLDTKGPEIRTAMLKDHEAITLEAGQDIIVEAVGDKYTEFEGFKTEEETRIGLSYAKLCQSVSPGGRILCADGTVVIEVVEILDATTLKGKVLNTKTLGERKNCNLPGVKVDIPVLTEKDIDDLQNFGCKHQVDYVAASFVQTGEDVQFIRKTLDDAGGQNIKIISKIENEEGLNNFDEILKYTDGVMVARGDLGMEIPSEKVTLAQKMLITKSNIAGKFVICATQMLESMIDNPLPTRAEMTDVANAVFDGADATMLSGETANGSFPDVAVRTMASIVQNAELAHNNKSMYNFIRHQTPQPVEANEAICSSAVQAAEDVGAKLIVVVAHYEQAVLLTAKYRAEIPTIVITNDRSLAVHCNSSAGQFGLFIDEPIEHVTPLLSHAAIFAKAMCNVEVAEGDAVVMVHNRSKEDSEHLAMRVVVYGEARGATKVVDTYYPGDTVVSYRSTKIGVDTILDDKTFANIVRKTKIVCTMGPKCWDEETLGKLIDAGLCIARFNFSHGSHEAHGEVLERYRKVCEAKGVHTAALLDTKGPEIRTAMLKDHAPISLVAGQDIIVEAVGDKYTEFEGFKTEEETRIGLSYAKLCQSVSPGSVILCADGTISIEVVEILDATTLKGKVLNNKTLGERKNCNLPGVKVDIPVLTEKDIDDLQNFGCKNKVDFVAASFVQTGEDVQFIRKILDDAGGQHIKIISKIENEEGLNNFDEILKYTDGVMIARGDLGMEIPSEKVAMAQKWMTTKCHIAGKFVICATQMLESMIGSVLPTRAEMTDVANAVFDGVDAVMLSGETANGIAPSNAVATMARIARCAELGVNHSQATDFIRDFTPKPVGTVEAFVSTAAKNVVDAKPGMVVVFSEGGKTARLVAKYRPAVPVLLVTSGAVLARSMAGTYGIYPMVLDAAPQSIDEIPGLVDKAMEYAVAKGLCMPGKEVLVLQSSANIAEDKRGEGVVGPEREMYFRVAPGELDEDSLGMLAMGAEDERITTKTLSMRSTKISLPNLVKDNTIARKTKIACAIGPKCWSEEGIASLLDNGMDIARFSFQGISLEDNVLALETLRKVAEEKGRDVTVVMDVTGPKVMVTATRGGEAIALVNGQQVFLVASGDGAFESFSDEGGATKIGVDYAGLAGACAVGQRVKLDDGGVVLRVDKVEGSEVECTVVQGTKVKGGMMVWLAATMLPGLTLLGPTDKSEILEFGIKQQVDMIAVSYVGSAEDVGELRKFLLINDAPDIKIISKIETVQGLIAHEAIIEASDGIIVARGDLGFALTPEKVALAQKMLITKCNVANKFVMVAKQMLESMISNPLPTRAEMTDVANAVLDGADVVMLSGETAAGDFPGKCVATMSAICRNAELATNFYSFFAFMRDMSHKPFGATECAATSVCKSAIDTKAGLIVVMSDTGKFARMCSKYRPPVPIVAMTTKKTTATALACQFGVVTKRVEAFPDNVVDAIRDSVAFAEERGLYVGGPIICVHGMNTATVLGNPVMRILDSLDDLH